ncbi:Dynein heavy chain 14, axonemal [Manis javanica]|nr:Dynein heavy chain 14, axonemal [Manis javanica]
MSPKQGMWLRHSPPSSARLLSISHWREQPGRSGAPSRASDKSALLPGNRSRPQPQPPRAPGEREGSWGG